MASMPLALSVHNFISSVGADAGFAAVVGLAILVLLYFAHARETANLRDQATELARRLEQAEARLAQMPRMQTTPVAPSPLGQPGVAAAPQPGVMRRPLPAAPAGMAGPALAAATRFIPAGQAPEPEPGVPAVTRSPSPAPAPAGATAAGVAPATSPSPASPAAPSPTAPSPATPQAPAERSPTQAPQPPARPETPPRPVPGTPAPAVAAAAVTALSRPAPATVAGGANGVSRAPSASPAARTAGPFPRPAGASSGVADRRASYGAAPSTFLGDRDAERDSSVWRRFALLVGALLVVGAAAAVVVVTRTSNSGSPPPARSQSSAAAGFNASNVTVAVLNGTSTNQLAHRVAGRLAAQGYKEGLIATASDQSVSTTQVAYLPGKANRTGAVHVAHALHLGRGSVTPINQAAQAVACPPPSACTANVVVTVGADLANGH